MKLTLKAKEPESKVQVNGIEVTLRPINPQTLQQLPPLASPQSADLSELLAEEKAPYRLGPQDILTIVVLEHPEVMLAPPQSQTLSAPGTPTGQVVDADGNLYFAPIGKVPVKGLTVVEVREKLTSLLSKGFRNPQVDVNIAAYRSKKIFVSGEVRNPASYPLTDIPLTLTEGLSRAGGLLPSADNSRILLTRDQRTWVLDFMSLLRKGRRYQEILLQDGDILHIPNREEEKVYLVGEFRTPRAMPLFHGRLTLAQVLSENGGMDALTANARSVYVLRHGQAANAADVYHLDARNPTALLLADRFPLAARDVVYVDAGTLVRWNRVVNLLVPFSSILYTAPRAVNELQNIK